MMNRINELLITTTTYFKKRYSDYLKESNKKEAIRASQFRQSCIYEYMCGLQADLYQVFRNKHYSRIKPVISPSEIRIISYRSINRNLMCVFSLPKANAEDDLIDVILDSICQHMNTDIKQSQHDLFLMYGNDLYFYHPFLANGIHIHKLTDNGTDIILIVSSNLRP